jgi:hypothetical protein
MHPCKISPPAKTLGPSKKKGRGVGSADAEHVLRPAQLLVGRADLWVACIPAQPTPCGRPRGVAPTAMLRQSPIFESRATPSRSLRFVGHCQITNVGAGPRACPAPRRACGSLGRLHARTTQPMWATTGGRPYSGRHCPEGGSHPGPADISDGLLSGVRGIAPKGQPKLAQGNALGMVTPRREP